MPKQPKQIAFDQESRDSLAAGVKKIARAVRTTLGPSGHCAIIDRGWGEPIVTKDGAAVAEEVELSDPYENLSARLVREAAEKTRDEAGDGSTTTTVLAEAIFAVGLRHATAGMSPMILIRGIRKAVSEAIAAVEKMSTRVRASDPDRLRAVATVAANNDASVGVHQNCS